MKKFLALILLVLILGNVNAELIPDWNLQFGDVNDDRSYGIAVDSLSNVYISGWTKSNLFSLNKGGYDVFLAKFDSSGVMDWNLQFGTKNDDASKGMVIDSLDNVYMTGFTDGNLFGINAGNSDVFLVKFDSSGVMDWNFQFGSAGDEYIDSETVAIDSLDNIYMTGWTTDDFFEPNTGGWDAFLVKFDSNGVMDWNLQLGGIGYEAGRGVAVDSLGAVYITGWTTSDLFEPNTGGWDIILAKFDSSGVMDWNANLEVV